MLPEVSECSSKAGYVSRTRPRPVPSKAPMPKTEDNGCISWEVTLTKQDANEKYGFSFGNRRDNTIGNTVNAATNEANKLEVLIVKGVLDEGLMFDWNYEHPDAEVHVGDRIAAVNEKASVVEMKQALRADSIVLKIRRYPNIFHVELTKTPALSKLGFKFERPSTSNEKKENLAILRITEVTPSGLLDETNKANVSAGMPHFVVTAGMFIEAVNGVEDSASSIADELRRCGSAVRLRVRRRFADLNCSNLA